MKTVTVKVEFQMPVQHLDINSVLEKMQDTVEDILVNYGTEHVPNREVTKMVDCVSVEIATSVPTDSDDTTG